MTRQSTLYDFSFVKKNIWRFCLTLQQRNTYVIVKRMYSTMQFILFRFVYWFIFWPDGLNPGVSLCSARGTNGIRLVFPLHHPAVCLCFTCLYLLPSTIGVVQLQTILEDNRQLTSESKHLLTSPLWVQLNWISILSWTAMINLLVFEHTALLSHKGSLEGWYLWVLCPGNGLKTMSFNRNWETLLQRQAKHLLPSINH